jgi:hypothetical protein
LFLLCGRDDTAEDVIQQHRELIIHWLEDAIIEKKEVGKRLTKYTS